MHSAFSVDLGQFCTTTVVESVAAYRRSFLSNAKTTVRLDMFSTGEILVGMREGERISRGIEATLASGSSSRSSSCSLRCELIRCYNAFIDNQFLVRHDQSNLEGDLLSRVLLHNKSASHPSDAGMKTNLSLLQQIHSSVQSTQTASLSPKRVRLQAAALDERRNVLEPLLDRLLVLRLGGEMSPSGESESLSEQRVGESGLDLKLGSSSSLYFGSDGEKGDDLSSGRGDGFRDEGGRSILGDAVESEGEGRVGGKDGGRGSGVGVVEDRLGSERLEEIKVLRARSSDGSVSGLSRNSCQSRALYGLRERGATDELEQLDCVKSDGRRSTPNEEGNGSLERSRRVSEFVLDVQSLESGVWRSKSSGIYS